MKLVVCFDNLGPYHLARMINLACFSNLSVVQHRNQSQEYNWRSYSISSLDVYTVKSNDDISRKKNEYKTICEIMRLVKPDVLFIPGWASNFSHMLMSWSVEAGIPMVVMSDSQAIDFPRTRIKEWFKSRLLRLFSSALVAGERHRDYLVGLGFDFEMITLGYDVVDNQHFTKAREKVKLDPQSYRTEYRLPQRYIFCCARLIEKKNLNYLIDSYHRYLNGIGPGDVVRDLVLAGDGPLRQELANKISHLGLTDRVHLPGFIQYEELPLYYALADCFVLPSVSEQWGLVVNEAMASGLPVIVSDRCGCADDLVEQNVNGLVFDLSNDNELADKLNEILSDDALLHKKGKESLRIIADWSLDRFSDSAIKSAKLAVKNPVKTKYTFGWIFLILMNKIFNRTQC